MLMRHAITTMSLVQNHARRLSFSSVVRVDHDKVIPFVECLGDYRTESYLEDSELPLYSHQSTLPRLPIPSLDETIERFLPSALPLARSEAESDSLKAAAKLFPQQAAHLQKQLVQRSHLYHDSSWLQQWWNERIYLQYRDPLFYVSYFYRLQYDTSCHGDGVVRATAALQAAAVMAQDVCSGHRKPDMVGRNKQTTSLCSTQYKYLFNSCRIPQKDHDSYRIYQPKQFHAIVASRGQFYSVPLTDEQGRVWSRASLQSALQACVEQSASTGSQAQAFPELGWLTTTDRDTWFDNYQLLMSNSELAKGLEMIQSAVCVICLDQNHTTNMTDAEHAAQIWHGDVVNSGNRWMDKAMQITVNTAGGLGYVGEHAMMDGMPAMSVCHYLMHDGRVDKGDIRGTSTTERFLIPVNAFETAFANMGHTLLREIERRVEAARQELTQRIHGYDINVLCYSPYGSSEMKKTGCSPDAFVQMAMQLASFRLFGEQVGTYEATQMRAFLHGRTETTRTVSFSSKEFVEHFCSGEMSDEMKGSLLQKACYVHSASTTKASSGNGVDRHFFGLSNLLRDGEPVPAVFTHEVYQRSKQWRLSTSTVPGVQCGFCCVEDDGLGIGYDVKTDKCVFTIVGRRDRQMVEPMAKLLSDALDEMMVIMRGQLTKLPKGKL